jgi:hypothetical protein
MFRRPCPAYRPHVDGPVWFCPLRRLAARCR